METPAPPSRAHPRKAKMMKGDAPRKAPFLAFNGPRKTWLQVVRWDGPAFDGGVVVVPLTGLIFRPLKWAPLPKGKKMP